LQKLFQAVEEARAMLVEAPGSDLPLLTYPQPVKEDMRKSSKQLLQFLRQAAVDPAVSDERHAQQLSAILMCAVWLCSAAALLSCKQHHEWHGYPVYAKQLRA
jgi:TorA maturation chaperone TorD